MDLSVCRADAVPEATRGPWRIERFTVDDYASSLERICALAGSSGRGVTDPGSYTRLVHEERGVVMSDTRDELDDMRELFWTARGSVLVNGLGLGCAVRGLLSSPQVTRVDVVEIDGDVIHLVMPSLSDPRLVVYQGDAFTFAWPPGQRWDCVWHDVWDELCIDNLANERDAKPGTYARLNRRYGRRCSWQGAWGQEYLRYRRGLSSWR